MASALPIDLLVDITSVGVRDTFTIGKLNTIIVEKYNNDLPNEKISVVYDLGGAQNKFGFNSSVAGFAAKYFGVISKSATKCDQLFIYNWNESDIPAVLKGGIAPALSTLKAIDDGSFKINEQEVSGLDFTSANSYADIASTIQTALRLVSGWDNASVSYNVETKGFIVKGSVAGAGETLSFLETGETGTDIHDKLGLTLNEGATTYEGLAGVPTFAEVLNEIDLNNGNYYVITPNFEFQAGGLETNLTAFGEFVNASNDRYCGVYSWNSPLFEVAGSKILEKYEGYNGLIIDNKKQEFQNGFVCGLISAMDLTKFNGNYNIAFNDATLFQAEAITEKPKYLAMVDNKANAPCKFGILGQDDSIYMDGTILGSKTESANVYICNSFLKMNQQIALYNMLKAQKLIGLRDEKSRAIIRSYLDEVFRDAVNANIIATGAVLTTTEKNVVISNFTGLVPDINEVLEKIERFGYFFAFAGIDTVKKELSITEAYVANAPVKKIVINNYILGA